jgi:hypothetical protein
VCPARAAAKDNLNLRGLPQGSHESDFRTIKLKADLFAQLAPQGFFRLLTLFHEAAGNAPARADAKDVIEQQHAPALIRNNRSCRHHKTRLDEAHAPPPHPLRRMTPQSTQHLFQHVLDNIKGKGKREKGRREQTPKRPGWGLLCFITEGKVFDYAANMLK